MYEILRDFAGPVATVIASLTAASVTWLFAVRQHQIAREQARIASRQAATALDQLRFNLFEKRYATYMSICEFLAELVNRSPTKAFSAMEVIDGYRKFEEAEFFFSMHLCTWLDEVKEECRLLLVERSSPQSIALHHRMNSVAEKLGETARRFHNELRFEQLTDAAL